MSSGTSPVFPVPTEAPSPGNELPPSTASKEVWLRRSAIVAATWLAGIAAAISTKTITDPDIWWHIATGDWIFTHRSLPRLEPFSWTAAGHRFVAYTWGFDVVSSWLYRNWGLTGIVFSTVALLLAIGVVFFGLIFRRNTSLLRSSIVTVVAMLAMAPLFTPRPWLPTILFFLVELWCLLRARETGAFGWLLALPALFILWANVHIQFVYGLFLMGLFLLEATTAALRPAWRGFDSHIRPAQIWAMTAVCTAATLINPNGWRVWQVVREYSLQKAAVMYVQEMQPLGFRHLTDWLALGLVLTAIFAVGRCARKCEPVLVALLVSSCWFAFRSMRDVWFLAIPAALVIASAWRPMRRDILRRSQFAAALVLVVIAIAIFARARHVNEARLSEKVAEVLPDGAARYVEGHPLPGPLYNSYDWGGYLIWRLHGRAVALDGRANVYGDASLEQAVTTWTGKKDWDKDPALSRANLVIAEADSPLASLLRCDPRFKLLYEDKLATVFARQSPR